jgi:hypothetical protein
MDFVFDDQPQQTAGEYAIVPAGIHQMEVKHAEEGPNEYKRTDENPEGMCLKLRLAATTGNYKFVFDDIPAHLGWRAKQLAEAIGLEPVNGKLSITTEVLIGRVLSVEVSHYTSKAGKVSAVVKRYVAGEKPKPAAKAAKPVAKKQTVPPDEFPDDIPF